MKTDSAGRDPWMGEDVEKGVLFLLPGVVIWFALETLVRNIIAWTRHAIIVSPAGVLRASQIDLTESCFLGGHHYEHHAADVREVTLTNDDGHYNSSSTSRIREGVKTSLLFDIKAIFNEQDIEAQE